ncbi:flavodoxin [Paenibacillus radicis (ex Gao et al. 2016)]|uniref:Flavodoxin n=1 Tax=Paenibacillus radicis (ex Gao et al. 2016) TaxID=1737354 RepID=A0A917LYS5_9BACL|nr:flavodoxin [Paenibacillus radicis (ex Gao et al. 2016)]GGG66030.1 flavodoxin [Paenibacillus radicis (ex Gao et al. 2016)]
MPKIIVLYTSLTGNTEEMAESITAGAKEAGAEVVAKEAFDASPEELLTYDGIIIGAYTWGDGELPDEFLDFYEDMDSLNLAGRKAAAFGSGDSSYPIFCASVDIIEEKLKALGAEIVAEGLKVEYSPSGDEKETCKALGRQVAEALQA